jgi:hypothetical protein
VPLEDVSILGMESTFIGYDRDLRATESTVLVKVVSVCKGRECL